MQIQHVIPQRDYTHEITVKWKKGRNGGKIPFCTICGQEVRNFKDTEGPEGLKALLRF